MKQKIQQKENLKKLKQFITFALKKEKAQNGKKVTTLGQVHKMAKWWVELGDLYVSSELIERLLKEHEEDEGI